MIDSRYKEMNAHQKAAFVAILLKEGSKLTTAGVARLTYQTWEGADKMMQLISGVLPIGKRGGFWQWTEE